MSEPVLKAIMRLFALVAKEDQVTQQERDHIQAFLADHLNQKAIASHLELFDDYSSGYSGKESEAFERETIALICSEINQEVVQKQKAVIILELMTIILADGTISPREELLSQSIGKALNVSKEDVDLIESYVKAHTPQACDHENVLIIESHPSPATRSKKIHREGLDGFIAVLYMKSTDIYFTKYIG
ncbi:MAG TPA: TerB family tellurite resistance protein, partial [Cyclobacteriaceae bacterium]|nr:TerB family tellurite resistance protein [Cyclobacteriaceae bacterium]